MKTFTLAQQAALEDPSTTLATVWVITREDGVVLRLTDLDVALVLDGNTYQPNGSTERTAIKMGSGLGVGNLDINGVLSSGQITDADLLSGRYDYAQLTVALAFARLSGVAAIPLAAGRFGEVTLDNSTYTVEVNDFTQALQTVIGEETTPTCRALFADARCQASLATWRQTYTLATVTDARTLVLTGPSTLPAGGNYANGLLEVLSGPAAGLKMEVKTWNLFTLTLGLYLPLPLLPVAGNSVRITAGCDKSAATCITVFNNRINFQGEDLTPGLDALAAPAVG